MALSHQQNFLNSLADLACPRQPCKHMGCGWRGGLQQSVEDDKNSARNSETLFCCCTYLPNCCILSSCPCQINHNKFVIIFSSRLGSVDKFTKFSVDIICCHCVCFDCSTQLFCKQEYRNVQDGVSRISNTGEKC